MPLRDLPRRVSPAKKVSRSRKKRATSPRGRSPRATTPTSARRPKSEGLVHVETPFVDTPVDPLAMYRLVKYMDPSVKRQDYFSDGAWDVDHLQFDVQILKARILGAERSNPRRISF